MPWLNESNRKWRERAREVAEKVVRPLAKKYDVEQAYPWEVKEALAKAGLKPEMAEVTMKASTENELSGDEAAKMHKLLDALESLDDVQEVYTSAVMGE